MSPRDRNDDLAAGIDKLSVRDSKMPAAEISTADASASPFHLDEQDVEVLASSEGFAILREHLAEHYADEYVLQSVHPR